MGSLGTALGGLQGQGWDARAGTGSRNVRKRLLEHQGKAVGISRKAAGGS